MSTNLRVFPLVTDQDYDPDVMLEVAKGRLKDVVIFGWDKDGEEYLCSNLSDGGAVLWLLERAKTKLMKIGDNEE